MLGRHGVKSKPIFHCPYFEDFLSFTKPPVASWRDEYGYPQLDMESVLASLLKYERKTPSYDRATWLESWLLTEQLVSEQLRGTKIRKLTVEEAMNIMDGSKTCGWPMCYKYQTKQQFWDSPDFQELYEILDYSLHNDQDPVKFVDTIFLKWEMRVRAKCGPGKARTVFCQDAVSALWGVQHCKAFDMALIENVQETIIGDTAIAVGMTPFSNNFQQLVSKFSDYVTYEIDGSSWDCSMFPEVHQQIANIRIRANQYDDKTSFALRNYYKQVSSTYAILPDGSVQMRSSGNPSGQAATTMDNSMWSIDSHVYCLKRYFLRLGLVINRAWLKKYVKLIVFGDDVILGIHKTIIQQHGFDSEVYQMIAKLELGHVFTFSNGGSITECRWLNFGWSHNRGRWWPTLDGVKIMNSLLLRQQVANVKNTLERAISIRTLAFGDPKLFEFIDSYVMWLVRKHGDYGMRNGILTPAELTNLYTGIEIRTPRISLEEEWLNEEGDYAKVVELQSQTTGLSSLSSLLKMKNHKVETPISVDLGEDLERFVAINDKPHKQKHWFSRKLGNYFDRATGKLVQSITGKPLVSEQKWDQFEVLEGKRKPPIEREIEKLKEIAMSRESKRVEKPKLVVHQGNTKAFDNKNKQLSKVDTLRSSLQKKLVATRKAVVLVKNNPGMKLVKKKKKGKGGKNIGIVYDYSSKDHSSKIRVILKDDQMVVHSRQLVSTITTASVNTPGVDLYTVKLNPSTELLGGIREMRYASTFDKFDIQQCKFKFNPARATTTSGNMFGAFAFDPTDYFAQNEEGLTKLTSKPGCHDCAFYAGADSSLTEWHMPKYPGKKPTFFTDIIGVSASDQRLCEAGQFVLKQGYAVEDLNTLMGSLWCYMRVHYYDPTVMPLPGSCTMYNILGITDDPEEPGHKYYVIPEDVAGRDFITAPVKLIHDTAGGVEYQSAGDFKNSYYMPPGVWDVLVCGGELHNRDTVANTATFRSWLWYPFAGSWQLMDTTSALTKMQVIKTPPRAHAIGGINSDLKSNYYNCRIVIPNDGADYYWGLELTRLTAVTNDMRYYNTSFELADTVQSSSTIVFTYASPLPTERAFLSGGVSSLTVEQSRIARLEKALESLVREHKVSNDGKVTSTPKVSSKKGGEAPKKGTRNYLEVKGDPDSDF